MELKKFVIVLEIVAMFIGVYVDVFHTNIIFNRGGYEAHIPKVQAKGQCEDAVDLYKQYLNADSYDDKNIIENLVAIQYADFNIDLLEDGKVKDFIYRCKNK